MESRNDQTRAPNFVVIGAGLAGLSATFELGRSNIPAVCWEASDDIGGLSRTIVYHGYRFDIGGHIFGKQSKEIFELWQNLMGNEFINTSYNIGMYFKGKIFILPLGFGEARKVIRTIGVTDFFYCLSSLLKRQFIRINDPLTLETHMRNRFGDRFFEFFFKPYLEKVWGLPCSHLDPEGSTTVSNANIKAIIKSKISRESNNSAGKWYPRFGAGEIPAALYKSASNNGIIFKSNSKVVGLLRENNRIVKAVIQTTDAKEIIPVSDIISSIPLKDLVQIISPELPGDIRALADDLKYRSLIIVNFILNVDRIQFGCINVQDPDLKISRIHCFKKWSLDMVPDPSKSSLECEFFVSEEDELWQGPDSYVIDLAKKEVVSMGLLTEEDILCSCVVRIPKAYPLLTSGTKSNVERILTELEKIENLKSVGRFGLHRYQSMAEDSLSGLVAARSFTRRIIPDTPHPIR